MKKNLLLVPFLLTLFVCVLSANQSLKPDTPEYNANKLLQIYTPENPVTSTQPSLGLTGIRKGAKDQTLMFPLDGTYTQILGANDDGYSAEIACPFTFDLYGVSYNSFWINNNGNITFDGGYSSYTPWGFPIAGYPMLAPFFADVDTRGAGSGYVWYKLEPHRVIVTWDHVGYFNMGVDRLNTFQVIFTDGTDPAIGLGNNVAFSYGDLAWTTGSASGGTGGLGGTPATVGINGGDGVLYSQTGRFDHEGYDYDGAYDNNDGIDWLDWVIFYYDASGAEATLTVLPTTIDNPIIPGTLPVGIELTDPTVQAFYASYPLVGTQNVFIPVGAGTWRAWAYYGGAWHQADVFPVVGPGTIAFSNVPFGAKADVPIIVDEETETLPVELSNFSATLTSEYFVKLVWITQSENGLSGYHVYRNTSDDLNTATLISPLITASNTSSEQIYQYIDNELVEEGTYHYWLRGLEIDGSSSFYGPVNVQFSNPGNGGGTPEIPVSTALLSAYPNPFNPSTSIRYAVSEAGNVRIEIYNNRGQMIRTLQNTHSTPGYYSLTWDGKTTTGETASSGIYLYRMVAGEYSNVKKMVMTK